MSGDIGELLEEFVADQRRRGLAGSTVARRRSHLNQWAAWLGSPDRILTATWEDLEAFDRHLSTTPTRRGAAMSPQTRYDRLSHLHQFYLWAIRHGHTRDDPTVLVDRPKLPRRNARPIRTSDLFLALEAAPATSRAWLALGAYGGLRCAEIATIVAEDIFERHLSVIGKGNRERTVPIHPYVQECLDALPLPRRGRIWLQPSGRPYTPSMVSRLLVTLFEDLDIAAVPHQLRHWCGVHTYQATGDIFLVQRLLGHSDPKTTQIYSDVDVQRLHEAVARLPRVA